jgi:hypothetical protein
VNAALVPHRTIRLTREESAAAFLADLWGETEDRWQRAPDGLWESTPHLDANAAAWGIKPQPIRRTGEELMEFARLHGWEG